jgi:hypothetical protein
LCYNFKFLLKDVKREDLLGKPDSRIGFLVSNLVSEFWASHPPRRLCRAMGLVMQLIEGAMVAMGASQ